MSLVPLVWPVRIYAQPAPTITWSGGASGDWNVAANWSPARVPDAADHALIDRVGGAEVRLNADASIASLTLGGVSGDAQVLRMDLTRTLTLATNSFVASSGVVQLGSGNLNRSSEVSVAGTIEWTGGSLGGAGELTVLPGAQLLVSGSVNRALNSGTIRNQGQVLWTQTSGTFFFQEGSIINETNGLFEAQTDITLLDSTGAGTAAVFQNQGTFVKTAGGGSTRFSGVPFHNEGVCQVNSGTVQTEAGGSASGQFSVTNGATLAFQGGTYTLNAGTVCLGEGLYRISGATVVCVGDLDANQWELSSGTLTGAGRFLVSGQCVWMNSTVAMSGELVVLPGARLSISGTGNRALNSGTLRNHGQVFWTQTSGTFFFQEGSIINETNGVFEAQTDFPLQDTTGSGTAAVFQNQGTFVKAAGAGSTRFIGVPFHNEGVCQVNSGTVQIEAGGSASGQFSVTNGATLIFQSGTYTLNAGTVCLGEGLYRITGAIVACVGDLEANQWELSSGTLTGGGRFLVSGQCVWINSVVAMSGELAILPGAQLSISGTGNRALNSGTIRNQGQVLWTQTSGTFFFQEGSIINETNGLFEAQTDITLLDSTGAGTAARFQNQGTIVKTAGGGSTRFSGVPFDNEGLCAVQSGTIQIEAGGSASGQFSVTNGATLAFQSGTYTLGPGTVCVGDGLYRIVGATVDCVGDLDANQWELSSGTLTGAGRFLVTGLCIWTGSTMTGAGETWVAPAGTLAISGTGNRTLNGRTLRNQGQVLWTQTSGSLFFQEGNIINETNGVFEVQSNVLLFDSNGGGTVALFSNEGTLRKAGSTGTTSFSGVLFENRGVIDLQSGILALNNNFAPEPNTIVQIRVAGTTLGTEFAQLDVNASGSLDGLLVVDRDPAFVPTVGTSLPVVTCNALVTPFQAVSNRTIVAPLEFEPVYSPTGLSLLVVDTTSASNSAPIVVVPPQSQLAYRGATVSLRPVVNGTLPLHYQWQFNSTNLPGANAESLVLANIQTNQSGPYRVIVTNNFGAVTSGAANVTVQYSVGTFISQSSAATNELPLVPGSGVVVEVFNGVGGGAAPTPVLLSNATPSGVLLSPFMDFPRPGTTVTVANNFQSFFTNTVVAPGSIASLTASNFVLRQQFLLRVESSMDLNTSTPDIDLKLGVGSDDGFYLTAGGVFLGSVGDRSFTYSWHDVSFEGEGLYPILMLFAANATGSSGFEFSWQTAQSGGAQIVPQAYLYPDLNVGDQLITFEEVPVGAVLSNQYFSQGILFQTLSGDVAVTTNFPTRFVPVSPTQVLADPNTNPTTAGEIEFRFVGPTSSNPATTTFVSFYVIDAESTGAVVTAYGPSSEILFTTNYHAGPGAREQVVIQAPSIARVRVNLGQGNDTAAMDDLSFSTPVYVNGAPTLDLIADLQADEGILISFTATASDPDEPAAGLVFSLLPGSPFGASISPAGQFTWTPSESQGPGLYPITVQVRDNAIPPATDTNQFTVTVHEVNRSPQLNPSPLLFTFAGSTLLFSLNTSDPDLPSQLLTHAFDSAFPSGTSLNAGTGEVTWMVPPGQPEGTNHVRFRVSDDGTPSLSATQTVSIVVDNTGPRITNASPIGTISTLPNFFDVFFDTDILIGSFTLPDAVLTGPGAPAISSVQRLNARQYRILLAAPLPPGTFQLTVGPSITDLAGNAMDQNANGVRGEPEDAFVATVTVELPDLAVVSINAPANGVMGGSVPVVFVLTNQGISLVTGPWQQRFQLANNAGGAGAVNLGNVDFAGPLAAGASVTITPNVILPNGQFGVRHLGVTTDAANQVVEYFEDNNTLYSANPIVIAAADLVATYIGSPGTAELGATFDIGFTTENTGDAATGPFNDRLWLSTQSNSVSGATLLATVPQLALAAGASVTRTQSVTLPLANFTAGQYFLVSQVDALNEQAERSEANNRISTALQLVLPPRPDLAVATVSAPANALSGQAVTVFWSVTNQGSHNATGVWSETIFLTTNAAGAGALELGTFLYTNVLPVANSVTRTQSVVIPPASPLGDLWFAVQTDSRSDVTEENETNNLGLAANATIIPAMLTLQPSAAQISEGASQPLVFNVTRNGSRAAPLTVTITNGDPTEILVTNQVGMPAGAASASFNVQAFHDGVVDGGQVATLTAAAESFQPASALITVLDVDVPRLTVQLLTNAVLEGQPLMATVSRDAGTTEAVSVLVASSDPGQLLPPAPVTIPAGASFASFMLLALDDSLIEYPATYNVSVSAVGYSGASTEVTVHDDDLPLLTVTLAPDGVSESAGSQAAVATITRSPVSPRALLIELESSNTNAARVPARVTIPAGETTTTVTVAAVDNALVDGFKIVEIRPWILASGGASRLAQGTPGLLTLTDDDGPTLKLSLDRQLVAEGFDPAAAGTVSRNSGTNSALLVTLAITDTNEVRVPPTVTIPAGALSASFNLASLADGVTDGTKGVTIIASAEGFVSGTAQIVVSDVNLPDLVVSSVSAPLTAETEAFVNIGYQLRNQGPSGMASNTITQRILLSRDPLPGDDLSLGQFTFSGPLPSGVQIGQTFLLRMPLEEGEYWVIAETDVLDAVAEVLEDNNRTVSITPINVRPAYDAVVSTTLESAPSGTPVPLTGQAFKMGGMPAPFSLVNIHIELRGTRRIIAALTDANGSFTTTWQPLPGEAGFYEIAAAHPGVAAPAPQDSFMLFGMRAYPAFLDLRLTESGTVTGSVEIVNAGDLTLTALAAQLTNLPANLHATVMLETNRLAGLATNRLSYTITALDASVPVAGFAAQIVSAEGAVLELPIFTTVEQLRPRLVARPARLLAGMKRGAQTLVSFELVNSGGAPTGPIHVSLPTVPWMALASVNPLPSLPPGETNRVTLQLTPPADLALTAYNGTLALNATGTGEGLPFEFRALSEAKGDLLISAVDEFTFYAEGSPKLTNATVTVRDTLTGNIITNGVTDATGKLYVPQLMEGYYDVFVTADRHADYSGTQLVLPGVTNEVSAFLSRQTVRYTWSVERIEIEDRYQITIETEFEANVPAPVVTIDPPMIDVSDLVTVGQFKQINVTLQNHGLIAADGNYLRFESHPFYEIKPLIEDIGRLPAKSSLTIPVTVRRIGDFDTLGGQPAGEAGEGMVGAAGGSGTAVPCVLKGEVGFHFECGSFVIHKTIPVHITGLDWICRTGEAVQGAVRELARLVQGLYTGITLPGGGLVPPGGGGGGGESLEIRHVSEIEAFSLGIKLGCDPTCLVLAAGGCISKFPVIGCFFSGFACGKGLAETGGTDALAWLDCGVGAAGCLIPPVGAAACLYSLTRCFISPADGAVGAAGSGDPIEAFKPGVRAMMDSFNELTGAPDGVWLNPVTDATTGEWYARFQAAAAILSEGGRPITAAERADLMGGGLPAGVPPSEITRFLDRWNRSLENYALGILRPADAPPGGNADFIDAIALRDHLDTAGDFQQLAEDSGFSDPINAIVETVRFRATAGEEGGVCARVKLRINQRAVLSREAFRATLELANDEGATLENIAVQILITDALGNDANARFGIREPELTNLQDVSGGGSVATGTSGTARWTIVPTVDAAPTEPVEYFVSGEMHYTLGGVAVVVPLVPVPITVNPTARLALHYFHERDVFSDDPHTDEIEPSIPFNLAVMVNNFGFGDARNFRITSAQPEIIENEKGLLIDFKIIATEVAGQNLTPTLEANFGTIPAGGRGIARWLLTSTLQGLFIDYSATFEHLDGQGNPRLSLIDSVEIHEMIRLVNADGPFDDGQPDFLVNDLPDLREYPDTLWLSDGSTQHVEVVTNAVVNGTVSSGNLEIQLSATMPGGWTYLRVPDPSAGGFRLVNVRRGDSSLVSNAWTTDRTFHGQGKRPAEEDLLHLLDYNSSGEYTLIYEPLPAADSGPPSSAVAGLPADSRALIPVIWSGQDNVGGRGLAFFDIHVSEDGGPFQRWLSSTIGTAATYQGVFGKTYAFYSIAVDQAGNREPAPATPDTQTTVTLTNRPPELAPISDVTFPEGQTFVLDLVAMDPDGDNLTFALLPGAPAGMVLNPVSGRLVWVTGEAHGPSTNVINVRVLDTGSPQQAATGTFTVTVLDVNIAPTLAPISSQTLNEGSLLVITNLAADLDLPPQQLTFSLGADAPAGAAINPTNGVFTWQPSEIQGGTTNLISVIVTDNGQPPLSATQTFAVIVLDTQADFTLNVGTTQLLSGASARLPLLLSSGADLTNAQIVLTVSGDRLTNLTLLSLAPEVGSADFFPLGANRFDARFHSRAGAFLQGGLVLGELAIGTVSNAHSAVAVVRAEALTGKRASSTQPLTGNASPGRVFIVGLEPILDALPATNRQLALILYARTGASYVLERNLGLGGAGLWTYDDSVEPVALKTELPLRPLSAPVEFFRAYLAPGSFLTIHIETNAVVLEWPLDCADCELEQSLQVGPGAVWTPTTVLPQIVNGRYRVVLAIGDWSRFYRLVVPQP